MPQSITPQLHQVSSIVSITETKRPSTPHTPRVGKRSSSPEMDSFKKALLTRRRESQLSALDDIAQLFTLEKVTDKKGPGPAIVRKEVRRVAQAWAKRNGEGLSAAQLLAHGLQAVSESTSSGQYTAWSEAERAKPCNRKRKTCARRAPSRRLMKLPAKESC